MLLFSNTKTAKIVLALLIAVGGIISGGDANAAGTLGRFIAYISVRLVPALDKAGNPIYNTVPALDGEGHPIRDANGNPVYNKIAKYEYRLDPSGNEIIKLGVHLTFDPSKIQVVTDLSNSSYPLKSASGFYCGFSINGSCPESDDLFIPDGYGDALPGSNWEVNIDNLAGQWTLSYDFSTTPVTITKDTNFFGFLFEPVVVGVVDGIYTLPSDSVPFVQHPESSQQYCITTSTKETGLQCSTEVPEPSTILGTGVVLVLGAIPVLKKEYAKRNKKKDKDA